MINYMLLFLSVFFDTFKNIYYNYFGKNVMKGHCDTLLFNEINCIGAVIYFIAGGADLHISPFSLFMALVFGAVTVSAQYFGLLSMSLGPMSYSVLFTYLSMLIPTIFGVIYFNNIPSALHIIGLVLMVVTFFMSCELKGETRVSIKWIFAAFASFLGWGFVGACQQLHQSSQYAYELKGFLLWTFIFSAILFCVLFLFTKNKENEKPQKLGIMPVILMIFTGVAIGSINEINLYLSGVMNPVIFFPVVNGGVILLSGIAAILIFKEKLSVKQWIGIVTGFVSILCLGF